MTTEYSIQKMVSDGTLSTIALGVQYLQRNDIYIRIAGEETPQSGAPSGYTWSFLDNTTLKILPVVPNGVEVVVYRRTDVDSMYNVYSQNAQFDESTIDENNQQLLYIAQEYLEQGIPGAGVDTIEFLRDDGTNTYYRIKRTDGSYSEEFAVPSASNASRVITREAIRRSYADAGYNLVAGSFQVGFALVNANDVVLDEASGKAFSGPAGTYPAGTPTSGFVDRSTIGGAWIVPEMFYSGTGPHSAAVQAAFDRSNATGELVYLGGQYLFDVPVTVKNGVNVISGQRASISPYPGSNNGTAFDFDAGNSNRRFELPALSGYSQVGIPAVAVRCDLAQIYVRQFVGCHTCFKTIADAGNNSILDVILEFNTMSACEVAWEMYCGAAGNVVQGCVLKGSFITDTTRVFKRTGAAAFDDGNIIDVYVVDFTNRCAGGAFLDNQAPGHAVPRMTAKVQSWFGGDAFTLTGASAVRVVTGQFNEGDMTLALATSLLQGSMPANQWRAGVVKTLRTAASLGQVRDMPNTPTLASFNGGVPLSGTEFIVRLTLTADLAAGAQAVGYFWNLFADGSYPRWSAVPIEGNTRLMLASIKDQSSTEASRVELAVRNTSGANIVAGQNVLFRVSRQ